LEKKKEKTRACGVETQQQRMTVEVCKLQCRGLKGMLIDCSSFGNETTKTHAVCVGLRVPMVSSSEKYQEGRVMEELAPTRQHICIGHMQQARQAMEGMDFMTGM